MLGLQKAMNMIKGFIVLLPSIPIFYSKGVQSVKC